MALTIPPVCDFGWQAAPFSLPGTDGEIHTLHSVRGERGTLIMFICNHCPYVRGIIDRIVRDAKAVQDLGVGVAAIMSNDWVTYPEDTPDKMAEFAKDNDFSFPYLIDESQTVAKAYGAVCTPDYFGFAADLGLHFRGRLDAYERNRAPKGATREMVEAMRGIAANGNGPAQQTPSMGCSIKWKEDW